MADTSGMDTLLGLALFFLATAAAASLLVFALCGLLAILLIVFVGWPVIVGATLDDHNERSPTAPRLSMGVVRHLRPRPVKRGER